MGFKIKLVPYEKFKADGVKSFMKDLREGTIILIDAKLNPEEEADIIEKTMKKVSEKFTGIELNSLDLSKQKDVMGKLKNLIIKVVTGKKQGLTIIGPAKIVRKIERNPKELLVYI